MAPDLTLPRGCEERTRSVFCRPFAIVAVTKTLAGILFHFDSRASGGG